MSTCKNIGVDSSYVDQVKKSIQLTDKQFDSDFIQDPFEFEQTFIRAMGDDLPTFDAPAINGTTGFIVEYDDRYVLYATNEDAYLEWSRFAHADDEESLYQ
jgi:hypothetical protein